MKGQRVAAQTSVAMGDLGGEDAPDGDSLTVAPGIAGDLLDGVSVSVPVVEDLPQSRLGEVLPHNGGLDRN